MNADLELVEAVARRTADLVAARDPRPLVDAHAAAALLGVPHTWLLAEARADRVPHRRLGRYVRFSPAELMAWADERAQGPVVQRRAA